MITIDPKTGRKKFTGTDPFDILRRRLGLPLKGKQLSKPPTQS